jgi:hypothetical protein
MSIRETLFGDMPLEEWGEPQGAYPWGTFAEARTALAAGDTAGAVAHWKRLAADVNLEPRHNLQAWHFLRQHGEQPGEEDGKKLLGVVIEVAMPEGLDLLAAYADHSARYYNFSGAGIVWERPDDSLDAAIDALLAASAEIVARIGPWERGRPGVPPEGHARLNFLTPSGLHFGQAPMQALAADPMGAPVLQLGAELMQALIGKSGRA